MTATIESSRRRQRRSRETRNKLIQAALETFAAKGFEGASTREIATRAGVAHASLPYHFKTKESLWKATADRLFGRISKQFRKRIAGLEGVSVRERVRLLLRDLVLYSSANPELLRFMLQEGTGDSERLAWLVERHVRPWFEFTRQQIDDARREGLAADGTLDHLYYMLIGSVALPYTMAAEFERLTGRRPDADDLVDAHVETLLNLFFPESRDDSVERDDN